MDKRSKIQEQITNSINQFKNLIVLCSIRVGKTKAAIDAIKEGESVLVVYPLETLRETWKSELSKWLKVNCNIEFTTTHSLKKLQNKYYDYLITDEIQLLSTRQMEYLKTIKHKKRVGLTGTLKKTKEKKLLESLNIPVKFRYNLEDAITDEIVKPYKVVVHFIDLDNSQKTHTYTKFGKHLVGTEQEVYDYYTAQMTYWENNPDLRNAEALYRKYMGLRTNFLYNSPSLLTLSEKLVKRFQGRKCLIYSMRTDIVSILSNNVFHSKSKDKKLLEEFQTSLKGHLGVVNCVQAGITIKNLNCVLFHTVESNTEKLQQKLGRSLLYEYQGEYAEIHICCLKDTQMEVWINRALESLSQQRINYTYKGKIYTLPQWLKLRYPKRQFFWYNKALVYAVNDREYKFLNNPHKSYILNPNKLSAI